MPAQISVPETAHSASIHEMAPRSDTRLLRAFVIAAGIFWSMLFVVVGLGYELQLYGDGSIFSYAIAVEDAWAFHWHNIAGRLFVYFFSCAPAELYVEATGNARGGIAAYGLLFFVAQLLGLIATLAADRSEGRILVGYACCSTACLCPLIFGFPTEMWMAHTLFWPALALCHYARRRIGGVIAVFVALLALAFTHEGGLIFAITILATLMLRGIWDPALLRAGNAFLVVMSIWALVKAALPPDHYFAVVFARAALHFFDITIFTCRLMLLLFGTLTLYAIAFFALRWLGPANAVIFATSIVTLALAAYWLWFDQALHSDNRYYLRTVLLIATPMLGVLAAIHALHSDRLLTSAIRIPLWALSALANNQAARATLGALVLVMLVHLVETAKFITAWSHYKGAIRELAMGSASDPALGDSHFVASSRIGSSLNRLSWSSTTQFLSVLLAPNFAPSRLVLDATANYFWLSCETATANEREQRPVPVESRRLVRLHACLHRPLIDRRLEARP
jgi:hypothetical protein